LVTFPYEQTGPVKIGHRVQRAQQNVAALQADKLPDEYNLKRAMSAIYKRWPGLRTIRDIGKREHPIWGPAHIPKPFLGAAPHGQDEVNGTVVPSSQTRVQKTSSVAADTSEIGPFSYYSNPAAMLAKLGQDRLRHGQPPEAADNIDVVRRLIPADSIHVVTIRDSEASYLRNRALAPA
jgi:hypothetical protein